MSPSTTSVIRLRLGHVRLPDWHPRSGDGICTIDGFAVNHPEGVIVFDTGCGFGNDFIDEVYTPSTVDIVEALNAADIDEREVVAIVNSHLHFDHCGQNNRLESAPFWVQPAEQDAARAALYTDPAWANVDSHRIRLAGDTERIVDGVTIVATPGHTPGHQSLVVATAVGTEIVGGQPCYDCGEFAAGIVAIEDVSEPAMHPDAVASLAHLKSFKPTLVHLSHDPVSLELNS